MTDYVPPPVGVSITVPLTGYVASVRNGDVTLNLRNGDTFHALNSEWDFALPDWLPPQFGDIIESSGDDATRYLYIGGGQWVNSSTSTPTTLTNDQLSRCRLLSRSVRPS